VLFCLSASILIDSFQFSFSMDFSSGFSVVELTICEKYDDQTLRLFISHFKNITIGKVSLSTLLSSVIVIPRGSYELFCRSAKLKIAEVGLIQSSCSF
jgi:hypothetical protein